MKRESIIYITSLILLAFLTLTSCDGPIEKPDTNPDNQEQVPDQKPDENPDDKPENTDTTKILPSVMITAGPAEATRNSITFTITATNSEQVCYMVYEESDSVEIELPTADEILSEGKQVRTDKPATITIDELESSTTYTIIAAAKASENKTVSTPVRIKTLDSAPDMPNNPEENPGENPEENPVDSTDADIVIHFNAATSFPQSNPNEFCIELRSVDAVDNPDLVAECTLYITVQDQENTYETLPAGTYTFENGELSHKFSTSYISIWDYTVSSAYKRYQFCSGQVDLKIDTVDNKEIYTIKIDIEGKDINAMNPEPYHVVGSYTGEIHDVELE